MNKDRRKQLSELCDRVKALEEKINELKELRDGIVTDLESVRDEEQEALDNLPESLQNGERWQDMRSSIDSMESALSSLEDIGLDIEIDDVVTTIDEARGSE